MQILFQEYQEHLTENSKFTRENKMEKLNQLKDLVLKKHDELYDVALDQWGLGTRTFAFIEGVVVTLLLVVIF